MTQFRPAAKTGNILSANAPEYRSISVAIAGKRIFGARNFRRPV
jgi:hypothetical protein